MNLTWELIRDLIENLPYELRDNILNIYKGDLHKRIFNKLLLKNILIIDENGSGKSTLVNYLKKSLANITNLNIILNPSLTDDLYNVPSSVILASPDDYQSFLREITTYNEIIYNNRFCLITDIIVIKSPSLLRPTHRRYMDLLFVKSIDRELCEKYILPWSFRKVTGKLSFNQWYLIDIYEKTWEIITCF